MALVKAQEDGGGGTVAGAGEGFDEDELAGVEGCRVRAEGGDAGDS